MSRSVSRFGFTRQRSGRDVMAPAAFVRNDKRPVVPMAGETMYGIGVMIALHLAFAFAVVLTLQAFGVT